jgi:YVTN family beta-propeller protein
MSGFARAAAVSPRRSAFVALVLFGVVGLLLLTSFAAASPNAPRAVLPTAAFHVPPPPVGSTNVSVGKSPNGATVDSGNGDVYVPNSGSNTVSVLSGTSVVKTIHVGKDPVTVTYDPAHSYLYVVNLNSTNVSVVSDATNSVVATVSGIKNVSGASVYDPANGAVYVWTTPGFTTTSKLYRLPTASPWAPKSISLGKVAIIVVYDPATLDLVATNELSNSLSIVNSTTNSVTTLTLKVGSTPYQTVYNPTNKDLYILDIGSFTSPSKTGNITVLASNNTITKTLKVGAVPVSGTYDPNNHDIYVVNATVTGKQSSTNSSVTPITSGNVLKTPIKVGQGAFYAAYDPANFDLYVPEANSSATAVIKGSTNTLLTTVSTPGSPIFGVYDPATGDMLIVLKTSGSVAGRLTLLSSPTSGNPTVVGTQVLGHRPDGYAYDATNSKVYVSNGNSKTVTVF